MIVEFENRFSLKIDYVNRFFKKIDYENRFLTKIDFYSFSRKVNRFRTLLFYLKRTLNKFEAVSRSF